jgi:short-subunit dehydrogenase
VSTITQRGCPPLRSAVRLLRCPIARNCLNRRPRAVSRQKLLGPHLVRQRPQGSRPASAQHHLDPVVGDGPAHQGFGQPFLAQRRQNAVFGTPVMLIRAQFDQPIPHQRRVDRLEALAAKISSTHGVTAAIIPADLTQDADLTHVEKVLSTNPDVQVLVNNAGLARLRSVAQSSAQGTSSQIALNIIALTRLTQAVVPAFVSRKQGAIVNIASVLTIHSMAVSAVYSGTKGFVLQYTRGLQQELADTGVKVQLVLPASTATEIWDESGIPLSALQKESVMTTENMVDAALSGFDQGETVTWPSVAGASLWDNYDAARAALFSATQVGKPAPRYKIG